MHSQPEEIKRCVGFIEKYLEKHGIEYWRFDHGDYPAILVMPESMRTSIQLMSHIDVVGPPVHISNSYPNTHFSCETLSA
jgi:acetylornithine deacetylase/succinyl-diaminopimelate desuccinylase-like protein